MNITLQGYEADTTFQAPFGNPESHTGPFGGRPPWEIGAITADIQDAIAQVKSRVTDLVQAEVRRLFQEALDSIVTPTGLPPISRSSGSSPLGDGPGIVSEESEQHSLDKGLVLGVPAEGGDSSEVFEGSVRLNVEANGSIRQMIRFVDRLCQNPHFRLLRLVGNNHQKEGMNIWLGLREPLCLKALLLDMEGVCHVASPLGLGPTGHERLVNVKLAEVSPA